MLGDPSLLRKSSAVDVMMQLNYSISSLLSVRVPSTLVLLKTIFGSLSVFVSLFVSGLSFSGLLTTFLSDLSKE